MAQTEFDKLLEETQKFMRLVAMSRKDLYDEITKLSRENNPHKDWNDAIQAAANKCIEWGDISAGGSGSEIIKDGPQKGQMYGQAYYNLAESIGKLKK